MPHDNTRQDLLKRILHMTRYLQPLGIERVMTSAPLRHHARQPLAMRMRHPHGVVPSTTHPLRRHLPRLHPLLPLDPIQHTTPQSVRTRRIVGISETVARPRDLDPDRSLAVRDVVIGRIDVLGPIAVQTVNLQHDGKPAACNPIRRWDEAESSVLLAHS